MGKSAGKKLDFRLTCARHRAIYVDVLRANGVTGEAEMERIRRLLVSVVMQTYPGGYLDHLAKQTCMGCAFEASGPGCADWVLTALIALIRGEPPPPSVYREWTVAMTAPMTQPEKAD